MTGSRSIAFKQDGGLITVLSGRVRRAIAAASLAASIAAVPAPAAAFGALAIGEPSDVVKDNISYGYSTDVSTRAEAEAEAVMNCRNSKAPPATRALCRLIASFKDQCVVIVLDPKAGTPGVGWSIKSDLETAEREALADCREIAGEGREKFCEVANSACDGLALGRRKSSDPTTDDSERLDAEAEE